MDGGPIWENSDSGRLFAQSYRCATTSITRIARRGAPEFLASEYVEFDGLGRVEEEGRKLPGTGWSTACGATTRWATADRLELGAGQSKRIRRRAYSGL